MLELTNSNEAIWDQIDRKMDQFHVEQIGVAHSKRDILVAKMDSMDAHIRSRS